MEKVINSIYGVIIYYIFIALLTLAVCFCIKKNNSESNNENNGYTYLSSVESNSL